MGHGEYHSKETNNKYESKHTYSASQLSILFTLITGPSFWTISPSPSFSMEIAFIRENLGGDLLALLIASWCLKVGVSVVNVHHFFNASISRVPIGRHYILYVLGSWWYWCFREISAKEEPLEQEIARQKSGKSYQILFRESN